MSPWFADGASRDVSEVVEERPGFFHSFCTAGVALPPVGLVNHLFNAI